MLCPERLSFRVPAFAGLLGHQGGLFVVFVSKPRVSRAAGTVGAANGSLLRPSLAPPVPAIADDTPGFQSLQRKAEAAGAKYFKKSSKLQETT